MNRTDGLSREQRALWFLHEVAPHSAAYHVASAIRLNSRVDAHALRRSLARLVERHDVLRTTFPWSGTEPVASIDATGRLDFEVDETTSWTEGSLLEQLLEQVNRPFDLQSGPLLRTRLYRIGTDTVLLVVLHSIVADARALTILSHELGLVYRAETGRPAAPVEPPGTSYADYVRRQTRLLESSDGERLGAYWQARLADDLPVVDLPFDRPRPRIRNFRGATVSANVDERLAKGLARVADEAGATRNEILLAAYAVLLQRYAGKDDVVVGYSVSGRPGTEWHDTVGYFENVLPLRVRLPKAARFVDFLSSVRRDVVDGLEHAEYPFQALIDRLQPPADPSRSPIFQTAFAVSGGDGDRGLAAFSRAARPDECANDNAIELPSTTARYDLTLSVSERGDELGLSFEYNRELFDADTVLRMMSHLERLLEGIVERPRSATTDLPIITDEEHESFARWNRTAHEFPAEASIHDLVAAQVERTPDAIAVEFEDAALTYGQLDKKVNGLAHHLRSLGAGPDVMVGICVDRSLEMLIAILGVLKSGAAYVPLDPAYPADRLAFMVRDSKAPLILAQDHLLERLRIEHPDRTVIDVGEFLRADGQTRAPAASTIPANVAYVIYTSGSTGTPKGVMVPHRAVVNVMSWVIRNFEMGPSDRMLQSRSPSFDVSIWEIFGALFTGATLVIGKHQDPEYLARIIHEQRITLAAFVPSEVAILLGDERFVTSPLRVAGLGSEALSPALCERFYSAMTAELSNNYAPTETIVTSTYWRCEPGSKRASIPIGRPIANVTVYVLDGDLRPVPVGVPGELYVGGNSLARGYLGRPGLTAEKFLPDPFSDQPGARMYRTGDLARWVPDGAIDFIGRADDQVKIRGFRVELGEVEATLTGHPSLREAVVTAPKVGSGDRRLVAYVVAKGAKPSARELRAYAKDRLPDYMVPSAFVVLDAMPLAPTGKVDRKALAVPTGREMLENEYVAPRTATEELIAAAFAELLQVDRVGVDDNFFEAGGNSLVASQVVSRVREAFRIELPLRTLFEHSTVAGLASFVEGARQTAAGPAEPRIERVRRHGDLELSYAQQRLWFLDQYEPGSPFYNESCAIQLVGTLDTNALERSLDAVVARHESLRTRFPAKDGRPIQLIDASSSIPVPLVDITNVDVAERRAEAQRRSVELARQPFDLAKGPLIRAQLIRLSHGEHWLAIVMHHIIGDGWSLGVLRKELATLYGAYATGTEPNLPPLAIQYPDFADWQRRWLSGDRLDAQLRYWKSRLDGMPALLDLPTDRPRPTLLGHRGARQSFQLPDGMLAALHRVSRADSATLYVTLLAAFQLLLHRYSRLDDIAVGSPVANRNHRELEEQIGFFVNTLVMRTNFSGAPTFRELLARVREVALGAISHQDVPFEKLVEQLAPQRSLSYPPLVQVMFVMEHGPEQAKLAGLEQRLFEFDIGIAKFDLTLAMEERPDGLHGTFEYNTDLYDASTIARMIGNFERLLAAIVADPERRISALPLLGEAERRQLVVDWNATATAYPDTKCVHELFEEQVDRTPDAIAVVFGNERLTYRELDRRANQLAHHLTKLGVGPDVLVGICVERSIEMVIGLVGIMKAGGAYVPLDPGYPAQRLAFMMEDSAVPVLVTQQRLTGVLPPHDARVVYLDAAASSTESSARPTSGATADHLAYVDFTSGSTGRPKGACVPHRAVARLVLDTDYLDIRPDDVFLQLSPIAFDASTLELWGPLLNGAKLVVFPPHTPSLDELGRVIVDSRITVLWLTSGLFHQMVDHRLEDLAHLRCLLSGGDVLSVAHVKRVVEQLGCTIINAYGPTENTTFTTCYPVPRPFRVGASLPIGRPIANTTVYVLDAEGEPVPIGMPGELYTGGDGLARGYLHRPTLTAEKFVPNPFGKGRLYRTGDLVRWLPDGNIEFLGRIDQQVKIRGFRIELGEVEAVLAQEPGIREVIAVVREDVPGDKRLVAYVVGDPALQGTEIRARLKGKLPEYMVPSVIMVVDALPLSPTGKVDRKALPAPEAGSGTEYVAPRTETELAIAQIFAEILRVRAAGALDDFFELGGHSLLATRVISRVRTTLGVELPLRTLFEAPTVTAFAARIDAARGSATSVGAAISKASRDQPLALSFAQERLWFLDQLEPGSPLYNVPGAIRLVGPLDVSALERSLQAVVARHESLRTTFVSRDGRPVQVIAEAHELELTRLDLRDVPEHERRAEATRRSIDHARLPFDLQRGPLVRASLLSIGPEEHWLLVSIHHIVYDGWSVGVFWRELAALYGAFREGREPTLPPLELQYADFASWQRTWLSGEVLDAQLRYWKQQLHGSPSLLELPTDRPRPPVMSYRGAARSFELPAALTAQLQALSRDESATLFMTLLAAFQTLLHRYSGQEDIVVGSPVANRNREETEDLIGFFVNTLVLRTDLSGNPTFRELLRRVREVALGAYGHQDLPFEKLVAELHPERSLSYAPLFQVMFVLQNAPMASNLPGLELSIVDPDTGTAKFDLTLFMEEGPAGLQGLMEYNSDLFDPETITRMIGHYVRLLEEIVADPGRTISKLPLLTEPERGQLLVDWNDTARAYGDDACIHELFEQQVDRTPDAIAMVAGSQALTYRQLDERANRLAHHLRACGAGPGELVGIFLERTADLVVALLGALKSGAAYVPLDPTYPKDRLAFIQEDARPKVLVTETSLGGRLPDLGARVVRVDADAAELARAPSARPARAANRTSLSHVIYTSGSTGRPKGVAIEHSVMVNYCRFSRDLHPPGELRAFLFATSVCFDMSLFELFVPLAWGGRVCVVDDLFSLPNLADAGVTFVNAVPSVLSAYLRAGSLPPSIEAVSCAGEPLPNALVQKLHAAGVRRVYDFYGPTETFICTWTVRSGEGTPIIGRPIANTQIYLLDAHGALVPRGLRGELYVGGEGLARGYLNRPELTAERFVPNPFGPGRLYKTGDVARWLPDGTLTYMGRIDHQVKIRGFRVEPGEIEVLLGNHPDVREAAVIAREDTPGDRRLVAYVVGKGKPAAIAELRAYLKERLPEYMVPSAFVALDALPQTPNGKLDRKALPAPEGGRAAVDRAYVAPRTPMEVRLAAIWSEILGTAVVGVDDNFFELGGHSLLATQVISRVRQVFEVDLPLRSLFEDSTVAGLAETIEAARRGTPGSAVARIERASRDGELALSFAQQRLWFLDHLEPESTFYIVGDAVRLRGPLDVAALERSLAAIVERHESLRTTFETRDGRAIQVIAPALDVRVPVVDLASHAAAEREAEAKRLAIEDAHRSFDLASGPLLRASLLRLDAEEHVMLLAIHHIVFDGWSFGVFWRELAALYRAFSTRSEPALPPLQIQYADFAAWQRRWLSGDVLDEQLGYWKQQLRGSPSLLELPTDRPRPPVISYKGAVQSFRLPAALAAQLQALSRDESATLFMTLFAAFQTLLHRYSGQDDIVVGSPVANRNREETEGLIGFFVNTLVLRTDLSGDPAFRELLGRVREVALGAYGHQDIPFEKLVEELQPERSLSYAPLFQVMFVLQNAPMASNLPGLELSVFELDGVTSKFDLTLAMEERPDGLHGLFEYNTDLYDASTIARMIGHFERLLTAIVADPGRRISALPLLGEAERRQLVVDWNATATAYPDDKCAHELFEEQVDRTPDAIAVVFESEQLTYRELDRRANQLAHHLTKLGVGPDVLVGICVERSIEMVIGLLGILKAGGAYVPLDPGYPAERLAFMMEDSAVPVLVTQDRLVGVLPRHQARVVRLDTDAISTESSARPASGATADHLAYVDFTSGSTGRPKGACVPHRAVARLVLNTDYLDIRPDDVFLQLSPIAFDASTLELWGPLLNGAKLVVFPPHTPSLEELGHVIVKSGVTVLWLTSGLFQQMVDHRLEDLAHLRCLLSGGDVLSVAHVKRVVEQLGCTVINGYGPTENTTFTCCYPVPRPLRVGASLPIGRPIANTTVYVLDAEGEPVPIGMPGELYTGGDGLARGYLHRPTLTAEKFVPNPFGKGRLYRTGDLVRWLPDGNIEFLGRIDQQVKIRGFRIELGEVEAVLAQEPGIREVIAVVREDVPGDKRLVAYVVGDPALQGTELRARLKGKLPDYMVPSVIVVVDALPLSPNGKIDRKLLPVPEAGHAAQYVAPRTQTELAVAQIFAEILRVPSVGARDDFFELGGHSLLAIQLAAAIEARLHISLPVSALFRAQTVEALAREIDDKPTAAPSNLIPFRSRGSRTPLVCIHPGGGTVFAYHALVSRLAPDRPCYALESRGLADGESPAETIEDMAAAYLRSLLAVRSTGPFHLMGWSFGGIVALEMARLLASAGHEVRSTTLIDTFAPSAFSSRVHDPMAPLAMFAHDLGLDVTEHELVALGPNAALARVAELAHVAGLIPAHLGVEHLARRVAVFTANLRAYKRYEPHTISGRVVLIRAADKSAGDGVDPADGWRAHLPQGFDVKIAPGSHHSMVEPPHVEELARLLDDAMAEPPHSER